MNQQWTAKWIKGNDPEDTGKMEPVLYLRREFTVPEKTVRAQIWQTAHGLYEFWINGKPGCQDKFKPGFTSYYKRLQVQTYDVTGLIQEGRNAWAVMVGDGWWRGVTGGDIRNNFGYGTAFLGELTLTYEDGRTEVIASDDSFRFSTGGLLASDMKLGDIFDAEKEPEGWKLPGFDDSGWQHAGMDVTECCTYDNLIPTEGVPVREKEHFTGRVFQDGNHDTVIDFGQNMAGYVEMTFRDTKKGQHIIVNHGEDLKDGCFFDENISHDTPIAGLKRFQQIDYYCRGAKEEHYKPMFFIAGFRYIRIRGIEGEVHPEDFTAIAVYSDCRGNGDFHCSDEDINRLVSNSRWSQKGNFLDVPTDCPTRERSPWTGDGQIYVRTACWFADVKEFYRKWAKDIAAEQYPNGKVTNIAPNCMMPHNPVELAKVTEETRKAARSGGSSTDDPMTAMLSLLYTEDGGFVMDGSAGWGDAAVIIPWTIYQVYGDRQILVDQYASAKAWADYMIANAKNKNEHWADAAWYQKDAGSDGEYIWDSRYHWGEWLQPDEPDLVTVKPFEAASRPDPEVPTAFLSYSSRLVGKMAEILGKKEDADYYTGYAEKTAAMYRKYFMDENGLIKEGRQSCHVRAIAFGLVTGEMKKKVAAQLNRIVQEKDYHLNTGFLSTPMLLNVLADNGYADTAYRILEQKTAPGWLAAVRAGATTIPEHWNGFTEHDASLNHYSYGAVCDFLFSRCAGIQLDEKKPGFAHFFLRPIPGGSLQSAEAHYRSSYGMIRSSWRIQGEEIRYRFEIPEGSTANIVLPSGTKMEKGPGIYEFVEGRTS